MSLDILATDIVGHYVLTLFFVGFAVYTNHCVLISASRSQASRGREMGAVRCTRKTGQSGGGGGWPGVSPFLPPTASIVMTILAAAAG